MSDILRGHRVEITFAKGEVVDGIQHVGLSYPIRTYQTIDFGVELEFTGVEILVIQ